MSADKTEQLRTLLRDRPACLTVAEAVLAQWPDHAAYLLKSFEQRSPDLLAATEVAAAAALKLMAGNEAEFAADYRPGHTARPQPAPIR